MTFELDINYLLAAVVAAGLLLLYRWKHRALYDRIPSPPRNLIGQHTLQHAHHWRQMTQSTKEYGPIYELNLGYGDRTFILGTHRAAQAILEKRSSLSADRPRNVMVGEICCNGLRTLFMPWGPRLRFFRKTMIEALGGKRAHQYRHIQLAEARLAVLNMGSCPQEYRKEVERWAASIITTITYDHPLESTQDPLALAIVERLHALGKLAMLGRNVLDLFPVLVHVPRWLNPDRRLGEEMHKLELGLFVSTLKDTVSRISQGKADSGCLAAYVWSRIRQDDDKPVDNITSKTSSYNSLTLNEGAYLLGDMFAAASDTTAATMLTFLLALCAYPHVLSRLQAEVDAVVGSNRMPTFEDLDDGMPYAHATLQEVLRWRPALASGVRHRLMEDVRFEGYLLPKGSSVLAPQWALSMDDEVFDHPEEFDPERFLPATSKEHGADVSDDDKSDGSSDSGYQRQDNQRLPEYRSAFGHGRRKCPGEDLARASVLIMMITLVWCFDIKTGDLDGKVDTLAYVNGGASPPEAFAVELKWRSEAKKELVKSEVELQQ